MSTLEERFFKKINEERREELIDIRNKKFHIWLQKTDYNNVSNNSKIKLFIKKTLKILKHKSYKIDNEKLFKDEIATLIYNLSVNEKS